MVLAGCKEQRRRLIVAFRAALPISEHPGVIHACILVSELTATLEVSASARVPVGSGINEIAGAVAGHCVAQEAGLREGLSSLFPGLGST